MMHLTIQIAGDNNDMLFIIISGDAHNVCNSKIIIIISVFPLFYRGTKSKHPKYVTGLFEYFWYIFCVYFNREWEHPTEHMDMIVIQIIYYVLLNFKHLNILNIYDLFKYTNIIREYILN